MNEQDVTELETQPFFSICIPTYNTADYIGEAIQSVLNQTFTDYEIVISDNCSTDNTKELVDLFKSDKIKYFQNHENIGLYPNMSLAVKRAKGKYIQVLCADDKLSPYCLEVIYHQLEARGFSHGAVGIGYSKNENDLQTEPLSDSFDYKFCTVGSYNFFDYLNQKIDTNLGGFLGSICAKKDVLSEIGYFGNDGGSMEADVITWKKIVLATDCILIDKPILWYYRTHPGQVSANVRLKVTIAEYFDFFNEYKNNLLPLDPNGNQVKVFLNIKISSLIVNAISTGFRQINFSYLFEALRTISKYGHQVPVLLTVRKSCDRIINVLGSLLFTKN